MTDQTSGAQPRQRRDEQLSGEELECRQQWRLLIERLGGQTEAVKTMHWTKQTVSRDWNGIPQPHRLQELCEHLKLEEGDRRKLEVLLRRARDAQEARRNNNSASSVEATAPPADTSSSEVGQHADRQRPVRWHWSRPRIIVTAIIVVTVAVTTSVLVSRMQGNSPSQSSTSSSAVGGEGRGPVQVVKAVSIPTASLIPTLRARIYKDTSSPPKVMTGYEFRNAANPSLCLTVADTGSLAGQLRDPVKVAACKLTPNQVWIPEEWDDVGKTYAHLVSDKYQGMCLNSRKSDGAATRPGDVIMLWSCKYPAGNEAWTIQDWYQSVAHRHQAYPLCLSNQPDYCIDADKRASVPGVGIRLWNQEAKAAGQLWS